MELEKNEQKATQTEDLAQYQNEIDIEAAAMEEEDNGQDELFGDDELFPETTTNKTNSKSGKAKATKQERKEIAKSQPKEEEKFDTSFTAYYAGHKIEIPHDGMTLEDIRGFMEMDFPELSKERTEMTVNKDKKQIVPVVRGAKKG